jgi:hypothetical protein
MLMNLLDAAGIRQRAARAGRILENEAVFNVVGTIGLMLFFIFLALRALPHFVRAASVGLFSVTLKTYLISPPPANATARMGHDPARIELGPRIDLSRAARRALHVLPRSPYAATSSRTASQSPGT